RYRTDEAGDGADQPGYSGDQRDLPTCRLRSNRLTRPRRGCGYDEANPGEQESNEEHEKTPSPDPTPATDCFGVRHTTTLTLVDALRTIADVDSPAHGPVGIC